MERPSHSGPRPWLVCMQKLSSSCQSGFNVPSSKGSMFTGDFCAFHVQAHSQEGSRRIQLPISERCCCCRVYLGSPCGLSDSDWPSLLEISPVALWAHACSVLSLSKAFAAKAKKLIFFKGLPRRRNRAGCSGELPSFSLGKWDSSAKEPLGF